MYYMYICSSCMLFYITLHIAHTYKYLPGQMREILPSPCPNAIFAAFVGCHRNILTSTEKLASLWTATALLPSATLEKFHTHNGPTSDINAMQSFSFIHQPTELGALHMFVNRATTSCSSTFQTMTWLSALVVANRS